MTYPVVCLASPADNDPVQLRDYRGRAIERAHWNGDIYAIVDPDSRPKDLAPAQRDALCWFLDNATYAACGLCEASFNPTHPGHRPLARIVIEADSADGICIGCADGHRTAFALVRAISARWVADASRRLGLDNEEDDDDEEEEEEDGDDPHPAA